MEVTIKTFFKFGSKENILDLYENGTIYCNPLEYFRKLEDEQLRGDSFEGTHHITNYPPDSKLEIILESGETIPLKSAELQLRQSYREIKANLFCLTAVTAEEIVESGALKLDPRLSNFGSHFLLVVENDKFYKNLIKAFNENHLKIEAGFVGYYDRNKVNGEINLFQKPNEFQYQKEFRIIIGNTEIKPITIKMGSLKGIAQIHESKHIDSVEFRYTQKSN